MAQTTVFMARFGTFLVHGVKQKNAVYPPPNCVSFYRTSSIGTRIEKMSEKDPSQAQPATEKTSKKEPVEIPHVKGPNLYTAVPNGFVMTGPISTLKDSDFYQITFHRETVEVYREYMLPGGEVAFTPEDTRLVKEDLVKVVLDEEVLASLVRAVVGRLGPKALGAEVKIGASEPATKEPEVKG